MTSNQQTGLSASDTMPCSISSDVIVVTATGTMAAQMRELIEVQSSKHGVQIIFADGTFERQLPPVELIIRIPPPLPELKNLVSLKTTAYERANPNQPWYAKFQKRRRHK
jgi:hypothetical protein